jgi:DNA processing protein
MERWASERLEAVVLSWVPGIGPKKFRALRKRFGSLKEVFSASLDELQSVQGISAALADKILRAPELRPKAERELRRAEEAEVAVLVFGEPDYPETLSALEDAPALLYCKGRPEVLKKPSVALVGSRQSTTYGEKTAETLARELVERGIVLVSGLARGIDTAAHRAVAEAGGSTVAVLGSGLLNIYPPENGPLAEQICRNGALLSELPLSAPPDAGHFPRRNRIIAGLASATVVVEADEDSGALITARYAAGQGKVVMAVPGPVSSRTSRGPHLLLKEGARIAENAEDILDAVSGLRSSEPFRAKAGTPPPEEPSVPGPEGRLMVLLGEEPVHIDLLSSKSALPRGIFARALLNLEMKGAVKALPGNRYVRN